MPPKREQIGLHYAEPDPKGESQRAPRSPLARRLLPHRRRSGKEPAPPPWPDPLIATQSDADTSSLGSTRRFRRPPPSEEVVLRQHTITGFDGVKYDYVGLRQLVLDHIILAENEKRREHNQSERVDAANVTLIFSPHRTEDTDLWITTTYTGYVIERKDGDAMAPFAVLLKGEPRKTFGEAMENLLTLASHRLEAYSNEIKEAIWKATQ